MIDEFTALPFCSFDNAANACHFFVDQEEFLRLQSHEDVQRVDIVDGRRLRQNKST